MGAENAGQNTLGGGVRSRHLGAATLDRRDDLVVAAIDRLEHPLPPMCGIGEHVEGIPLDCIDRGACDMNGV